MEATTTRKPIRPLPCTPPNSAVSTKLHPSRPFPRPLPSPPGSSSSVPSASSSKCVHRDVKLPEPPRAQKAPSSTHLPPPSRPKVAPLVTDSELLRSTKEKYSNQLLLPQPLPLAPRKPRMAEDYKPSYAADKKGKRLEGVGERVTCLTFNRIAMVPGDESEDSCSEKTEDFESPSSSMKHAPCTPHSAQRRSRTWVCEKRGKRWEERDYQVILRTLRSL